MVIRNFKRKTVITGVRLIIVGFIISIVGFGIDGFELNNFRENNIQKWYKIINIGENISSFNIGFQK